MTPLSPGEYRTLALYAELGHQGMVAEASGLSIQTIKNQLTSSYRKLDAPCAVLAYRALGWLNVPGSLNRSIQAAEVEQAAERAVTAARDLLDAARILRTPESESPADPVSPVGDLSPFATTRRPQ